MTWDYFLNIHGAIFFAAIAAYYKYGDRTELFQKSHSGNFQALKELRIRLSGELARHLKSLFEDSVTTKVIIQSLPEVYTEKLSNVTDSEAYRDLFRSFFEQRSQLISAYLGFQQASHNWNESFKGLSWLLYILAFWEIICLGGIFFSKVYSLEIPNTFIKGTFVITGFAIFTIFAYYLPRILSAHSKMIDIRREYDSF